jgi:pimeloyl-ACP methyl ester carboxylesterase
MQSLLKITAIAAMIAATGTAADDKFFNSNGVNIRYTDQGSGEPVILIHGYSVNQEHEWVVTGILPKLVTDY